jgi:aminopeptidase N
VELADSSLQKPPLHIPVAVGLVDARGTDIALKLAGEPTNHPQHGMPTRVLDLTEVTQAFTFTDIPAEPTPSVLRNFSAPVILEWNASDAQLAHLLAHDSDPFNRWEAGQSLALGRLITLQAQQRAGLKLEVDRVLIDAAGKLLADTQLDPAFKTELLSLPDETAIAEAVEVVDPQAIRLARIHLLKHLAQSHQQLWANIYDASRTLGAYSASPQDTGKRGLKHLALRYWVESGDAAATTAALAEYRHADNMTDRAGALMTLLQIRPEAAVEPLAAFYKHYDNEPLAIDRWFRMQASARGATVADIEKLMRHKAFTLKNPNRLRSVFSQFCMGNPAVFHSADGYALWSETLVRANAINPEVTARMARALDRWRKLTPQLQTLAQAALQNVASARGLSIPVREVIEKALKL